VKKIFGFNTELPVFFDLGADRSIEMVSVRESAVAIRSNLVILVWYQKKNLLY